MIVRKAFNFFSSLLSSYCQHRFTWRIELYFKWWIANDDDGDSIFFSSIASLQNQWTMTRRKAMLKRQHAPTDAFDGLGTSRAPFVSYNIISAGACVLISLLRASGQMTEDEQFAKSKKTFRRSLTTELNYRVRSLTRILCQSTHGRRIYSTMTRFRSSPRFGGFLCETDSSIVRSNDFFGTLSIA